MARSCPSNVVDTTESVAGSMIAAPMPSMTASPRMRLPTFQESAASSEPLPNSAAPTMKTRRWP